MMLLEGFYTLSSETETYSIQFVSVRGPGPTTRIEICSGKGIHIYFAVDKNECVTLKGSGSRSLSRRSVD